MNDDEEMMLWVEPCLLVPPEKENHMPLPPKEPPVADKPRSPVNVIPARSPKGSGTVVSANLAEHPAILEAIRLAAKADDREVSNWLRRRLVVLYDANQLIPPAPQAGLFSGSYDAKE